MARFFSGIGNYLGPMAVTFALLDEHRNLLLIGVVLAMRGLVAPVGSLVGGWLADTLGARQVELGSNAIRALAHGGLAVLLLTGRVDLVVFVVAELLVGLGWSASQPAMGALGVQLVSPDELAKLNGNRGVAYSLAMIVAPLVGGGILAVWSPGWALGADASFYLVALGLIASLKVVGGSRIRERSERGFRTAWRVIASRTWIWQVGLTFVGFNVAYASFFLLGPAIAKAHFHGAAFWGEVASALGVGALLGSVIARRVTLQRPAMAIVGLGGLWGLPLVALGVQAPVGVVIASAGLAGVGFGLFNPLWHTALQRAIPRDILGRVLSLDSVVSSITLPLAYVLIGAGASAASAPRILIIVAIGWVVIAGLVMGWLSLKYRKNYSQNYGYGI